VEEGRELHHPWLDVLLGGQATREQLAELELQLIALFDHLPRLYGPPFMTGADYKIRRMIVDRLLLELELEDGTTMRVGEGAHAELARQLARALGISDDTAQSVQASQDLEDAADTLVATLFEPPYWVALGAAAKVELEVAPLLARIGSSLRKDYGLDKAAAALFSAPSLFSVDNLEHGRGQVQSVFDEAKLRYYVERVRDEWFDCWKPCLDAASQA
jgi:pyrroloquinoline quinone (PQQ) biosynthesis protein C